MIKIPTSPYKDYCLGYQNPEIRGSGYILGLSLGVGKAKRILSKDDATMIDHTNAFDRAEVDETYLGQTNMITVSSFCGPQGKVWGLDLARAEDLYSSQLMEVGGVPVYSAQPLMSALTKLFGTNDHRRFPLLPGTHVPCATKNIAHEGPVALYAAFGFGIPENRTTSACLMMEDIGVIPAWTRDVDEYSLLVKRKIAESVLEVGKNQRVTYREIFVALKSIVVHEGEIGCALVAAPYFALAKNALKDLDLTKLSITEWEKML